MSFQCLFVNVFCKHVVLRSYSKHFVQKLDAAVLKDFKKLTGKNQWRSPLLVKLQAADLLCHGRFSVNIRKIFRIAFPQNTCKQPASDS